MQQNLLRYHYAAVIESVSLVLTMNPCPNRCNQPLFSRIRHPHLLLPMTTVFDTYRQTVSPVLLLAACLLLAFGVTRAGADEVIATDSTAPMTVTSPSGRDDAAADPSPASTSTPAAAPVADTQPRAEPLKSATDRANQLPIKAIETLDRVEQQNQLSNNPLCPELNPTQSGFGYEVFKPSAALITEGAIDDSYLVNPGDEIVVSIWGEMTQTLNLEVTREGFIDLPEGGGRIQTNGISLQTLRPKIIQALSQIYASFINAVDPSKSTAFVDIQLGKLRPQTVFVLGEVRSQGAYQVSPGMANVINLINNAKGVCPGGSLREIRIQRGNGHIDTVDLYGFFLSGDIDLQKIRLRPGDSISVPLKRKSVTIEGQVLRPQNYEIIGDEGLRKLVELAGGFSPDAYLKQVQLKRFEINRGEVLMDVDLEEILRNPAKDLPLINGDTVSIGKNVQVRKNTVSIKGDGITRAGTYEWTPGMMLSDLISKASGLREYAFLDRADLIRTEDDFSKKLMVLRLSDFYKRDENGTFALIGTPDKNLALHEMDEVVIQSAFGIVGKDPNVSLEGHVKEPGRFVLARGMKLYDLIFARGGFQDESFRKSTFLKSAHIFRRVPGELGQKILSFDLGALLNNDASANLPLENEDVIHIFSADEMRAPLFISIDGLVKKPGKIPMAEGLTLEDAIMIAGGLRPDAVKIEALISRSYRDAVDPNAILETEAITHRIPIDIQQFSNLPREQRIPLKPADRVTVRALPGWERSASVLIEGEVTEPGNYSLIEKNELLSTLIRRAGGLKENALPEGATVQRAKPSLNTGASPETGAESYRIPINLRAAMNEPGGTDDLVLQADDRIVIPSNPGVVEVRGAVRQALSLQHKPGRTLDEYIELCGGYLEKADAVSTRIFTANGAAFTLKSPSRGKKGKETTVSQDIPPGSVVEVPFIRATQQLQTVEVKGAVTKPVLIQHIEGAPLGYYLNLSGGFTPDADLDKISVLLPDGGLLVKAGDKPFNPVLPGGSQIMVTTKSMVTPK